MIFCHKCGSQNHRPGDCSAPDQHLSPPVPVSPVVPVAVAATVTATEPEPVFWQPRWPGGPAICSKENRAAFGCESELEAYWQKRCKGCMGREVWKCDACGQLHFKAKPPSPSGDHSGHSRTSIYPRYPFTPFMRKPGRESAFGHVAMELPRREVAPEEPKKQVAPRPKPKQERKAAGMLF